MPTTDDPDRPVLSLLQGEGEKLPDHEDLVQLIAHRLRDGTGSYYWKPVTDPDNQAAWRKAARAAGRLLGQRVRTHCVHDMVSVWVVEEDRTPEQVATQEAHAREAVKAMGRRMARARASSPGAGTGVRS